MNTQTLLMGLLAATTVSLSACKKEDADRGVPNESGSAHKDPRIHTPEQENFDGRQQTLVPGSRHE